MKLQNVIRAIFIFSIALFVCISLDFSMISATTRSSVKIVNGLKLNEKQNSFLSDENDVEINYNDPTIDHRSELLNLNTNVIKGEDFTPDLYEWLWKNN